MHILKDFSCTDWNTSFSDETQSQAINAIENGSILHFPQLPFLLQPHEQKILTLDFSKLKTKNISFNPGTAELRRSSLPQEIYEPIKQMMQRFSQYATTLVNQLLCSYNSTIEAGRTSFRPIEILGRVSSYRKDDTRLHVDAFPATPNHGRRILRVFANINPEGKERVWRVGEAFSNVAYRFLPLIRRPLAGKAILLKTLKITKTYRTEYDHIMLHIHDKMKADLTYQAQAPQQEIGFLPGSSWIVQTDHVSHAAMSGQHLLEQTFYLPVNAMQNPELSPLRILENLTGRLLV